MKNNTRITKYTKHYYIGTERIASTLGTMKNLGLLCENVWPGSQDIIDEMGIKTMDAGDVLTADYDAFEKELQLPEPYLYETYICTKLEHDAKNYDTYWYHPDHLGSSSYITNLDGNINQHMEYLPFGETLVEEHLNSYNSPYKFNAKEFDAETGWYYYGARYYNPKWSIWLSVDKEATRAPQYSPYIYSFNNPVTFFDPDGNWPWPVHIRSFIAASSVGPLGSFRGDGRGPSTLNYPNAWSRVKSSFTVDPVVGTITNRSTDSDPTVFYGLGTQFPPDVQRPDPEMNISNEVVFDGQNAVSFNFKHSAQDPITPSLFTPDLDVQASLLMIEDPEAQMLSITGRFTGDQFPSTEAFIEDQGGNRLLIGAHKEKGGLNKLFGENKRPTFNVNMMIEYDDNGIFTRVHEGGKTYTPTQWEKEVQSRFNDQ